MTKAGDDRPMMDHSYDGIQEYDNPMPRWWLLLFAATIAFVPIYMFAPGLIGAGGTKAKLYDAEMDAFKAAHPDFGVATITADALAAIVADPAQVTAGRALYATNCVACHRADGGGLIGPNLTDEYWIHGGTPMQVHATINDGVLAKGMPPWGKVLKPADVNALTAYVRSLQGATPLQPKPPEGDRTGADGSPMADPATPRPQ